MNSSCEILIEATLSGKKNHKNLGQALSVLLFYFVNWKNASVSLRC